MPRRSRDSLCDRVRDRDDGYLNVCNLEMLNAGGDSEHVRPELDDAL
jgi:hypothetical protein